MVLKYILFEATHHFRFTFYSKKKAPVLYTAYPRALYAGKEAYWKSAHSEVGREILAYLKEHKTYIDAQTLILNGENDKMRGETKILEGYAKLLSIGRISPEDYAGKKTELEARWTELAGVKAHWDMYAGFCTFKLVPL